MSEPKAGFEAPGKKKNPTILKPSFFGLTEWVTKNMESTPSCFLLTCPKRIDLLAFRFSSLGPFLVMAPKGDHLLLLGPFGE